MSDQKEWIVPNGWVIEVGQDAAGYMFLRITTPERDQATFKTGQRSPRDKVLRRLFAEWSPNRVKELR